MGIAYSCLGDFNNALECLERHLNIAKGVSDKAGEGDTCTNLGVLYENLGNFQAAKDDHFRHLRITQETGDKAGERKAYAGLAQAFNSRGDFEEALKSSCILILGKRQETYTVK